MGKKILGTFLFILLFITILNSTSLVQAELGVDLDDPLGVGINPQDVPQNPEELKNVPSEFLKNEWTKLLGEGKFYGTLIRTYRKIAPVTDPIFRYTVGMEPELSGLFFLTFFIWIVFLIYLYRILSVFSTFSNKTAFVIALALVIVMGLFGFPKFFGGLLMGLINGLATWWIRLIVEVVLIIIFIILMSLSKKFREYIKTFKERRARALAEEHRRRLKSTVETGEKYVGGITKEIGRGEKS